MAEAITANSGRERTTAFCYAVGWTQHTVGVQNIRAAAILQLLLGNIGRPGGGILALRGHATIQGSTDIPTLYNLLPGYLQMPLESQHRRSTTTSRPISPPSGWWHNLPKYMVSLLKAWYGERATAENEWGYQYLPKLNDDEDYSYYPMFFKMKDGKIKGLFVMGENFAVGGPGARVEREAMRKLDWCVVRDPFLVETADFWKLDGVDPATVDTEVFFMPAAWPPEKDGSFTNTQRMLQWHEKAVDPPGDGALGDVVHGPPGAAAARAVRRQPGGARPALAGDDLGLPARRRDAGAERAGGRRGDQRLSRGGRRAGGGFGELRDDGSTACGCWIYSGVVPEKGVNLAARRERDRPGEQTNHSQLGLGLAEQPAHPLQSRLGGSRWPAVVRAQAPRLVGSPSRRQWTGYDAPDFPRDKAPDTPAQPDGLGIDAHTGADPFIMNGDGRAWLYAPSGLKDGPLPAHYEPFESPVANALYPELAEQSLRRHLRPARQSDARARATRAIPTSSRRTG